MENWALSQLEPSQGKNRMEESQGRESNEWGRKSEEQE